MKVVRCLFREYGLKWNHLTLVEMVHCGAKGFEGKRITEKVKRRYKVHDFSVYLRFSVQ